MRMKKKQEISSKIYSFEKKKLFKLVEMIFIQVLFPINLFLFFAEKSTKNSFLNQPRIKIRINESEKLSNVYRIDQ